MLFLLATGCLVNTALYEERAAALTDDDRDGVHEDGGDCDDADAAIFPGAPELCNGVDDNCDGRVDDVVAVAGYLDRDDDGYGDPAEPLQGCASPTGYVTLGDDCDDDDPAVYPGAVEICDATDNDCNDAVDEGLTTTTWYADDDTDGYGDVTRTASTCARPDGWTDVPGDCDDTDSAVFPDAGEALNEVDDDCSGVVDDLLAERDGSVIFAEDSGARAGSALVWGDIDRDGEDELIVGAPGPESGIGSCAVYLLDGDVTHADFSTVVQSHTEGRCGATLAVDEEAGVVLVGAPHDEGGIVTVWSIGAEMEIQAEWAEVFSARGGDALAVGDLDGDGSREAVVGAWADSAEMLRHHGTVWFMSMSTPSGLIESLAMGSVSATTAEAEFGRTLASGIDVNSDGYDDFVVGSAAYGDGGYAWLFEGGTTLPSALSDAVATFVGTSGSGAGTSVSMGNDWDIDGFPDWWVGAPGGDALYGFAGNLTGTLTPAGATTSIEGTDGDQLGASLDATGWSDGIFVGAPGANGGLGAVYGFGEVDGVAEVSDAAVTVNGGSSAPFISTALAVRPDGDVWSIGAPSAGTGGGVAFILRD